MPIYRKLTPIEQAAVNKSARKCYVVVFGLVGIVVMLCVVITQL